MRTSFVETLFTSSTDLITPTLIKHWESLENLSLHQKLTRFFSNDEGKRQESQFSQTEAQWVFDFHHQPLPVESLRVEIQKYGHLPDDNGSSGVRKPSQEMLELAQQLLDYLPSGIPLPRPMISEEGEIGLYWDSPEAFADLEIENDGQVSVFTKVKQSPPKERFFEGLEVSPELRSLLRDKLLMLARG